jgi:hypothetical protein
MQPCAFHLLDAMPVKRVTADGVLATTVLYTSNGTAICQSCAQRQGLRTQSPRCVGRLLLVAVPCAFCRPVIRRRSRAAARASCEAQPQ